MEDTETTRGRVQNGNVPVLARGMAAAETMRSEDNSDNRNKSRVQPKRISEKDRSKQAGGKQKGETAQKAVSRSVCMRTRLNSNRKRKRGGINASGKWVSPYSARLKLLMGVKYSVLERMSL